MTALAAQHASTTTRRNMLITASEPIKSGAALLEAAYGGKVQFHKVRNTGGLRRWPVLTPGTAQREQAENVAALRADGVKVQVIAESLSVSVPTVRRMIVALAFTQELEAMPAGVRKHLAVQATEAHKEGKAIETTVEEPTEEAAQQD